MVSKTVKKEIARQEGRDTFHRDRPVLFRVGDMNVHSAIQKPVFPVVFKSDLT